MTSRKGYENENENDTEIKQKNQQFMVRRILSEHCGLLLTPKNIDRITSDIIKEMTTGATSWAFK